MKNMTKLLVAASGISIAAVGVSPAFAAGTTAGDSITNNVTVEYQVGGVDQTDVTASDTFVVDRVVNIDVAEVANVTTSVSPGEDDAATTFDVTNNSNDVVDINLAVTQLLGGSATHGGTDNFNISSVRIFVEDGTTPGFQIGEDTLLTGTTFLDEMAEDETRRVYVVGNIALTQVNGDVAGVTLTGVAREGGTGGSQGALIAGSAAPTAGEDTVVQNGTASDEDDYTVAAANLSALKQSFTIDDPVNGPGGPFYNIPGATVEYCIAVVNAAGGADATNVDITDIVPADTTFVPGSIVVGGTAVIDDNGTPANPADDTITSCSGGAAGGSFAAGTVSASLGTVSAGTNETVVFQVTVD